jgi:LSD1 subclass zinc finger protein
MELFEKKSVDEKLISKLDDQAHDLIAEERYAEAAEIYRQAALEYLKFNQLIYADYCHKGFLLWLKAGNREAALQQAQIEFHIMETGGWLKRSIDEVLSLQEIISKLQEAGHNGEAETFRQQLNNDLAEFGLMLRPPDNPKLPSICPTCGAALQSAPGASQIQCSFCGLVVHAH